MDSINIRPLTREDNPMLATIIRNSLKEFGANKPGTVYYDETTDRLHELFKQNRSSYFVAVVNNQVVGGGGIYPSKGLPDDTAELVKMYLEKTARGKGIGRMLISHCIAYASASGYKNIYLETMPELKKALSVYEKFGFEYLTGPLGDTGHFGCDVWMLKKI